MVNIRQSLWDPRNRATAAGVAIYAVLVGIGLGLSLFMTLDGKNLKRQIPNSPDYAGEHPEIS